MTSTPVKQRASSVFVTGSPRNSFVSNLSSRIPSGLDSKENLLPGNRPPSPSKPLKAFETIDAPLLPQSSPLPLQNIGNSLGRNSMSRLKQEEVWETPERKKPATSETFECLQREKIEESRKKIAELETQVEHLEKTHVTEVNELKAQLQKKDSEIAQLQKGKDDLGVNELKALLQKKDSEIAQLKKDQDDLDAAYECRERAFVDKEKEAVELQNELFQMEAEIDRLRQDNTKKSQEINKLQQADDRKRLLQQVKMTNELREERDELKSEVANLKKELEQQKLNAGPDIEQDMVKWVCAEVESKNDGGNEAHSKAMEEVEQLRLEASEKETYIEDLRQRLAGLEIQASESDVYIAELKDFEQQLPEKEKEIQKLKAALESEEQRYKDMDERHTNTLHWHREQLCRDKEKAQQQIQELEAEVKEKERQVQLNEERLKEYELQIVQLETRQQAQGDAAAYAQHQQVEELEQMFAEKESKYTKVIQNQRADIARLEAQLGDVVSQVETIEWQEMRIEELEQANGKLEQQIAGQLELLDSHASENAMLRDQVDALEEALEELKDKDPKNIIDAHLDLTDESSMDTVPQPSGSRLQDLQYLQEHTRHDLENEERSSRRDLEDHSWDALRRCRSAVWEKEEKEHQQLKGRHAAAPPPAKPIDQDVPSFDDLPDSRNPWEGEMLCTEGSSVMSDASVSMDMGAEDCAQSFTTLPLDRNAVRQCRKNLISEFDQQASFCTDSPTPQYNHCAKCHCTPKSDRAHLHLDRTPSDPSHTPAMEHRRSTPRAPHSTPRHSARDPPAAIPLDAGLFDRTPSDRARPHADCTTGDHQTPAMEQRRRSTPRLGARDPPAPAFALQAEAGLYDKPQSSPRPVLEATLPPQFRGDVTPQIKSSDRLPVSGRSDRSDPPSARPVPPLGVPQTPDPVPGERPPLSARTSARLRSSSNPASARGGSRHESKRSNSNAPAPRPGSSTGDFADADKKRDKADHKPKNHRFKDGIEKVVRKFNLKRNDRGKEVSEY